MTLFAPIAKGPWSELHGPFPQLIPWKLLTLDET